MFGLIVMGLGFLVTLVGYGWFLLAAGRVSLVWLLATLVVPFAGLVFLIIHWHDAKKPFSVNLAGLAVVWIGFMIWKPV